MKILVCTHRRYSDTTPACAARGGEQLLEKLKVAAQPFSIEVGVIDCFGHCQEGAVVKITPNGVFYYHVTESDIPKIMADIISLNQSESIKSML